MSDPHVWIVVPSMFEHLQRIERCINCGIFRIRELRGGIWRKYEYRDNEARTLTGLTTRGPKCKAGSAA